MSRTPPTPQELLRALVETPSVSGAEGAATARLVDYFAEHDRDVFVDDVGNVHAPGDDALLLTSHVDTVPGEIPVRVADGVLWGHGAVDAKGPLCAMAVAAVETGVSFVGVVGEKTEPRGARHLVETRAEPDALVNGEPSGWDAVTLGCRGLLADTYVARSASGHASRPEPNAIEEAIRWWGRLEAAFSTDRWATVTNASPPSRFGSRAASPTTDSRSKRASPRGSGSRSQPTWTPSATRSNRNSTSTGPSSRTSRGGTRFRRSSSTRRGPLPAAFRRAVRQHDSEPRLLVETGTSDMNRYADAWNCPMVTYGPGDSDLGHAPDERLDLAEYERAIAVLEAVCETFVA
jgi:LysW-gamma-L-lysine carboxypeptidase